MENDARVQESEKEVCLKSKIWTEVKKIWIIAGPAMFTKFVTFSLSTISQAFIGRIGSTELAAFSLVHTVIIRFQSGALMGMASALQTLCGQAYGARRYHMLEIYFQRSWLIMTLYSILLSPVFVFTAPILKILGQDPEISEVAGNISIWLIPVSFAMVIAYTCQNFLQTQNKNMVTTYFSAFSLGFHILMSWALTVKFKLRLQGTLISTVLAYWIPNIGQLMFVICGGCPEIWTGFSSQVLRDIWPFLKLSISSGVMLCLDLWYNSILVLLTGNLKNAKVSIAALSICLNMNGWQQMISSGFLVAASIRVSNELGRANSKAAKFSIIVVMWTTIIVGVTFVLFVTFMRGRLAYLFTNDKEVSNEVANLSLPLAISMLIYSVQPTFAGVAIGAGNQKIVACITLTCCYIIGIPVGIILGYVVKMGVKGVWTGMLIGILIQTIILIIMTYRTDWTEQVIAAKNRITGYELETDNSTRVRQIS